MMTISDDHIDDGLSRSGGRRRGAHPRRGRRQARLAGLLPVRDAGDGYISDDYISDQWRAWLSARLAGLLPVGLGPSGSLRRNFTCVRCRRER